MKCRVCGELQGKPHYGTVCCASCKAFFRRRFLNNDKKECRNGNRCDISATSRKNCSSCRYKKCLKVGLRTEEIRGKRKCSPFPNIFTLAISTATKFSDISYEDAMRVAKIYLNLELNCDIISSGPTRADSTVNSLIDMMLSCSISEFLGKKTAQCPRFKRCWKAYELLNSENFVKSWARSLVHFLDFSTRIPCFNKMPPSDKRDWFISRFVPCTLISMAFHSSVERRDGLLFGCSNVFPYTLHDESNNNPEDLLCKLFNRISAHLFAFVIHPMINLNFTEHHFALLKACIFYSLGLHLFTDSEESRNFVTDECAKHRNALLKLLIRDISTFDEKADILFQIDDMCLAIERAARCFDNEIKCFYLMGVPIAQKRMIIEFHNWSDVNPELLHECHRTICPRNRRKMQTNWFNLKNTFTKVVFDITTNKIVGYATIRIVSKNKLSTSPFYAENLDAAKCLLSALLHQIPLVSSYESIGFTHPAINQDTIRLLQTFAKSPEDVQSDPFYKSQFTKKFIHSPTENVYSVFDATHQFV